MNFNSKKERRSSRTECFLPHHHHLCPPGKLGLMRRYDKDKMEAEEDEEEGDEEQQKKGDPEPKFTAGTGNRAWLPHEHMNMPQDLSH